VIAGVATAVTLLLGGCSSTKKVSTSTTTEDAPSLTSAPPAPAADPSGKVTVTVTVGSDDFDTIKGTRVVRVKKAQQVTPSLTDPSQAEGYDPHVSDLEAKVGKAETGMMTFTADKFGQIDLGSHTTNKTLPVVVVSCAQKSQECRP
jgi:hypothetical protein